MTYPIELLKAEKKILNEKLSKLKGTGIAYDFYKSKGQLIDIIHCYQSAIELLEPHKKQISKSHA